MALRCNQEGVRNTLLHALGRSRAKESLIPHRVFLRLQVDDEQLCDTPLWDGDLPLGSVGPDAACGTAA